MGRLLCGLLVIAAGLSGQSSQERSLESNQLWIRDPALVNAPWEPIGRAQRLTALAALDDRLYAVSVARYVLVGEPSTNAPLWRILGEGWSVSGLAALGGKLYVATREGEIGISAPVANINFKAIGRKYGIAMMAALEGNIYAIDDAGRLLVWKDAAHSRLDWIDMGRADRVTAMAALNGRLYAATLDNRLIVRETTPQDRPWKLIGHAENITAMTAFRGKLYAAAYSPGVIPTPRNPGICSIWETNQLYWAARSLLRAAKLGGKISNATDCLAWTNDPQTVKTRLGGPELADLITGSCAQCACAAEF